MKAQSRRAAQGGRLEEPGVVWSRNASRRQAARRRQRGTNRAARLSRANTCDERIWWHGSHAGKRHVGRRRVGTGVA